MRYPLWVILVDGLKHHFEVRMIGYKIYGIGVQ